MINHEHEGAPTEVALGMNHPAVSISFGLVQVLTASAAIEQRHLPGGG
jgi:hypothetical protein